MIPLLDLKAEYRVLKTDLQAAIEEVLQSGSYILGEKGTLLESTISQFINTSFCLGVANGTDALLLALEALGISRGDEVITTPFTFFATAEVIVRAGAIPVFVDIEPESYNIDPDLIEKAITEKTKAIMVVHLFGQVANMDRIMDIAKRHNFYVIEDACQAIGASFKGKMAGTFGDVGCFSFYPTKNLGAFGDGGMVVTNNPALYETINCLRNHGSVTKYVHHRVGINSRLDELQAAILLVKFKRLSEWNQIRGKLAARYTEQLSDYVQTPAILSGREHIFHQYCIETTRRDELAAYLLQKQVMTAVYYPVPLHLQEALRYLHYKSGDFSVAESVSNRILALPIQPMLSEKEQQQVIDFIKEFCERDELWIKLK
ncbi:DegT/DnrJ/EryC1/StrS family aminotransferase [Siminovitchia acidinfaciens]|uniref:DegT/DnrJ/EryC1/StrS family aminotransferase n=1 Tax=Siminovitchia acidinfaciens TaxID=2321395 RepID=A0A429XV82_9BACI|nr:DegT/DnrJ/EryC1/StrS family aminotransferase [Siminovitchia acidinfaciens]RST72078.1 DegT/DnrJ/EryC1/StrS family aminotransferase [Siminovitchia acidinfaciens]